MKLGDILTYIVATYPEHRRDDLSNARITKIVYLSDWVSALTRNGQTVTDLKWQFAPHGPWVKEVIETAEQDPRLTVEPMWTAFNERKQVVRLAEGSTQPVPELDAQTRAIIDHVIGTTQDLSFNQFIRTVYGTHPIIVSSRGSSLPLPSLANSFHELRRREGASVAPAPAVAPADAALAPQ